MRIYTRGGDKGRTSLFSGARVAKDDARIEALGSLDELVAAMGLAKATPGIDPTAHARLEALQAELYLAMADLASDRAPEGGTGEAGGMSLPGDAVARLEAAIDAMDADLPPLTDFIIPGSSPVSAALHLARTVCRRAERRVQAAGCVHALPEAVPAYLNRLSDLLFVMARWTAREAPDGARDLRFKDRLEGD